MARNWCSLYASTRNHYGQFRHFCEEKHIPFMVLLASFHHLSSTNHVTVTKGWKHIQQVFCGYSFCVPFLSSLGVVGRTRPLHHGFPCRHLRFSVLSSESPLYFARIQMASNRNSSGLWFAGIVPYWYVPICYRARHIHNSLHSISQTQRIHHFRPLLNCQASSVRRIDPVNSWTYIGSIRLKIDNGNFVDNSSRQLWLACTKRRSQSQGRIWRKIRGVHEKSSFYVTFSKGNVTDIGQSMHAFVWILFLLKVSSQA